MSSMGPNQGRTSVTRRSLFSHLLPLISFHAHVSTNRCHDPATTTQVNSFWGLRPFGPANIGAVWRHRPSASANVGAVWSLCPLTPADISAIWCFRPFAHIRSFCQMTSLEIERPKRLRTPATSYLVTPLASVWNLSQCAKVARLFSCEPSLLRQLTHLESARCYV